MKRILIAAAGVISVILGAVAAPPAGYYDRLEGLCGEKLKEAVKNAVKNHNVIDYGTDTWKAFGQMDVKTVNGVDYWCDMYSPNLVRVNYPVTGAASGMNIEHSVANSWWGKTKNDAYKDLVHLNPSDADANNRKANYPLGEISGSPKWTNGETSYGNAVSGQGGGAQYVYEPCDQYKGDFARVFMYIFTVYDNISWASKTAWMYSVSGGKAVLEPWAYNLMLRWSENDPVSEKEEIRNDKINEIQGNRNPFVDYPELAEHIWGSKKDVPFSLKGDDNEENKDNNGDENNNGDNNGDNNSGNGDNGDNNGNEENGESGIYGAGTDKVAERIFDLQGRELSGRDLKPGIYIVVKGTETTRILIR